MRYKIIDWKVINNNPKLTKNDDFIVGDTGVNKIKLELGAEVEGYNVVMLLRRNIDVKPTIYQAKVLNSVCEFDIEETDIEKDIYEIYIRIYNGTKTYASSGLVYENKEGKRFYKFTVNKFLAGDAGAIIEELKKQIVNAETKDTELKETINNSNSTKLSLEEAINNSNLAKTSLEGTIRDANTAKDNLNSTITNATDVKNRLNTAIDNGDIQENSLKAEIAKVPLELKKLQDESTNQQGLIRGEGTKQVKAVTDTGVVEVGKVSAEGSKQTTNVTTEGNTQFSRVNSEGIKQVGLVTTEGTKQTKLVTDEGVKQLGVVTAKGTEIIKAGNGKIEEIKKTGQLNFNTMLAFSEWLGSLAEYNAITLKRMNRRYSVFSDTGELLHTYYWKAKSPKEYFDPKISLVIQGGENGLEYWNDLSDPMPIKIAGGKTLAECIVEETEDYIIYSDGQKVVLNQYVPGTYDLYLERLKETENNPQLYGLTEPTIDHAKMLNDINNEQLAKLAKNPMLLPEGETPIQLTSRTIWIPIDFCCRVDKKTGEIYIGEGYETGTVGKPPVSAQMPSGKMSILTNATLDTHSFILKCANSSSRKNVGDTYYIKTKKSIIYNFDNTTETVNVKRDVLASKNFLGLIGITKVLRVVEQPSVTNELNLTADSRYSDSFKQFLIYKGNLTETELKAENDKNLYAYIP